MKQRKGSAERKRLRKQQRKKLNRIKDLDARVKRSGTKFSGETVKGLLAVLSIKSGGMF